MNAGMVILQDGTPCIVYDEDLPGAIRHVEFSMADYCMTLVYEETPIVVKKQSPLRNPAAKPEDVLLTSKIAQMNPAKARRKFEYPVDSRFVEVLREKNTVAISRTKDGQLVDIQMISVVFTSE